MLPGLFIPFTMDGPLVQFSSRSLTVDEIETLPHIVITSSKPRDLQGAPL